MGEKAAVLYSLTRSRSVVRLKEGSRRRGPWRKGVCFQPTYGAHRARSVNRARASLHRFSYISHSFLHTQKHMTGTQTRRISSVQRHEARLSVTAKSSPKTSGFVFFSFRLLLSVPQLQQDGQTSGLSSLCKKSLNKCTGLLRLRFQSDKGVSPGSKRRLPLAFLLLLLFLPLLLLPLFSYLLLLLPLCCRCTRWLLSACNI